jgi:hypothetical protein
MRTKLVTGFLIVTFGCVTNCPHIVAQKKTNQAVLDQSEVVDDVTVRFWYLPQDVDFSAGPLIFLPASSQDPQLDTRPTWILYVSLSDLHNVVRVLAQSHLEWKESSTPQKLVVESVQLPQLHRQTMEIAISNPNGSATTEIKTEERVCSVLADVYGAVQSPKARESMAFWAANVKCVMKPYQSTPLAK